MPASLLALMTSSELLVYSSGKFTLLNQFNGKVVKEVALDDGEIVHLKKGKMLACGQRDGRWTISHSRVVFRDPSSFKVENTIVAHSSGIASIDFHSNYMVTCGYSIRYKLSYPEMEHQSSIHY